MKLIVLIGDRRIQIVLEKNEMDLEKQATCYKCSKLILISNLLCLLISRL